MANNDPTGISIKVVGVGGAGGNALQRMAGTSIEGVDLLALNTDVQALRRLKKVHSFAIGPETTGGIGSGGRPETGRKSIKESQDLVSELLERTDMVFIAAGMGGGTGTGAAPTVAETAREMGALTVGVVTEPFAFEGRRRSKHAEEGIARLKDKVDTLITIPNDRLLVICGEHVTMEAGFRMADDILRQGVQSIAELVTVAGEINLDFADIKAVMSNAGPAWMAIGSGSGEDRAIQAAEEAIHSPLLDVSLDGARGVIFNVTGPSDLTINEVHQASEVISQVVDPEANIMFGMVTDMKMENEVKLTIIATGFPAEGGLVRATDNDTIMPDTADLDVPWFLRNHPATRRRMRGNVATTAMD